jgi:hypothetical protein
MKARYLVLQKASVEKWSGYIRVVLSNHRLKVLISIKDEHERLMKGNSY